MLAVELFFTDSSDVRLIAMVEGLEPAIGIVITPVQAQVLSGLRPFHDDGLHGVLEELKVVDVGPGHDYG
jgi:hypothetical protein